MALSQEQIHFRKGVMTVIAGCLIQLFNGCFFLWSNVANYVLSYFYKWDPMIGQGAIFYVDTSLTVLCVIGYQTGTYCLQQR